MPRLTRLQRRGRLATASAVIVSLVVAGSAVAASRGAPWRVGYVETIATYTTGLSGSLAGSVLSITNSNTSTTATAARAISAITRSRAAALLAQNTGGGPAAQFLVGNATIAANTIAPFTVNSRKVVTNLNADLVDGLTASQLQRDVQGSCAVGETVTSISDTGALVCAPDAVDGGDAAKLGGVAPSGYLRATGKAADADTLDGADSSGFVRTPVTGTFTNTEQIPANTCRAIDVRAPGAWQNQHVIVTPPSTFEDYLTVTASTPWVNIFESPAVGVFRVRICNRGTTGGYVGYGEYRWAVLALP